MSEGAGYVLNMTTKPCASSDGPKVVLFLIMMFFFEFQGVTRIRTGQALWLLLLAGKVS